MERKEGAHIDKWRATGLRTLKTAAFQLQQARCAITRNGIYHRLTFENPAGHRKSQRRVTNMHNPHNFLPPSNKMRLSHLRGGALNEVQVSNGTPVGQCTKGAMA
jgi:hypothetical protein